MAGSRLLRPELSLKLSGSNSILFVSQEFRKGSLRSWPLACLVTAGVPAVG